MPNFCKLELSGHIGKIKVADKYVDISVAFNTGKKDENKPTAWFNCRAIGKAKDSAAGMSKGDGIVITSAKPEVRKGDDGREWWTWLVFECAKYEAKDKGYKPPPARDPSPPAYSEDDIPF